MTAKRSRSGSFKIVATLGMVLLMAFVSACDLLATEGARSAIANGREIRAFEDENLRPIEQEMNDLWVTEIQPREIALEDLRHEMRRLEEEVMNPLWDAQKDIWAPGGEASEAQILFQARYRELELLERALQVEQHELDTAWQDVWDNGGNIDPEFQALEDLRYEQQRELDRIYRFGYRPIDDIWDQIQELNSAQGFSNTDSQIESEVINVELRRLWDLQHEIQNSGSAESNEFVAQANAAQEQLNNMYNFGWDPINEMWAEIERLEQERDFATSPANSDSINAQIAELESLRNGYVASRDAELAGRYAELEAAIAANGSVVEAPADTNVDNSARIAELVQIIADLEDEAAAIVAEKNAEKDALSAQIDEIKASYDQLHADAIDDFEVLSASMLEAADVLKAQIDPLVVDGGDDAVAQLAILQPQYDSLIAGEQAEEDALHALRDQYDADEDADLAEPKAAKDAVEAQIAEGLTHEIDAQITEHKEELASLQNDSNDNETPLTNDQVIADLQADIAGREAFWNGLIDDVSNQINALENERSSGTTNDPIEARIHSLRLQIDEYERALTAEITKLEEYIRDLYHQADTASSGDSGQFSEIQAQIDALNDKLETIWAQESANGIAVLRQVQELERQARALEEENEQVTRKLEEELWDLEDKLSRFYKDQESVKYAMQEELQAISDDLQQRRREVELMRWAIDEEQRDTFDAIELARKEAEEQIRLIEEQEFGKVRGQIRLIEEELRTFYAQQRELENAIRDAQALVEEKKRELENQVFEALESAAGTVDEAGDTVLTATEEAVPVIEELVPEIDESVATPTSSSN